HEVHAYEMHAYEVHAREVHAHGVHARELHAHETYACEIHTREMHAHEVQINHQCPLAIYRDLSLQNTSFALRDKRSLSEGRPTLNMTLEPSLFHPRPIFFSNLSFAARGRLQSFVPSTHVYSDPTFDCLPSPLPSPFY